MHDILLTNKTRPEVSKLTPGERRNSKINTLTPANSKLSQFEPNFSKEISQLTDRQIYKKFEDIWN